ncbi:MAG: N-acetylmuramoyl-L-alanine amidase [Chthoniobacter sp.]|nr:N-acetylmuramoyl-L-alanine amidase [Chthoniobacter sp.]
MRFLCVSLIFVSLAARAGAVAVTKDEWGHRPGPRGFTTVMIDAGHGGKDSGAVSATTGQREKDAALDVARRVAAKLGRDFRVKLLRGSDQFIDLDDRVNIATAGADVLVSIHFNSGPSSLVGPETFYWRVDSHGLAVRLQEALRAAVPRPHNSRGLVRRRIRLTRNPDIPCVLVECGYLSNATEARRIAEPAYRDRLAGAIAEALRRQAARGDEGTGPLPPPLNQPPSRPTDARE